MWFLLGSVISMATLAFCGGCVSQPAEKSAQTNPQPAMGPIGEPQPQPSPASPDASSGTVTSDESIGSEIRRRLNADPATAVGIVAVVEDGNVTLRGEAPSLAVSWRAEGTAHGVKGVKSVVNQIIVNTPSATQ
jgi:hypothetical protein